MLFRSGTSALARSAHARCVPFGAEWRPTVILRQIVAKADVGVSLHKYCTSGRQRQAWSGGTARTYRNYQSSSTVRLSSRCSECTQDPYRNDHSGIPHISVSRIAIIPSPLGTACSGCAFNSGDIQPVRVRSGLRPPLKTSLLVFTTRHSPAPGVLHDCSVRVQGRDRNHDSAKHIDIRRGTTAHKRC